jgi:hypothetical protein
MVGYIPQSAESGERGWARAKDISQTGVRLLAPRHFKRHSRLSLRLYSTTSLAYRVVSVRVAFAYRDYIGSWVIGCKFDKPLSQAELDALL